MTEQDEFAAYVRRTGLLIVPESWGWADAFNAWQELCREEEASHAADDALDADGKP